MRQALETPAVTLAHHWVALCALRKKARAEAAAAKGGFLFSLKLQSFVVLQKRNETS